MVAFACPSPSHAGYWDPKLDKWVGSGGPPSRRAVRRGPLSTAAADKLHDSERSVGSRIGAANDFVGEAPSAGTCTGSGCTSAPLLANSAGTGAADVSSTAASRLADAESRRQEILQRVNDGAERGDYGLQHVAALQDTFRDGARPTDDQIESLHPKLQDPAHALRSNQAEIDYLRQVKEEYGQVAQNSGEMGRKLAKIRDDAVSLGSHTGIATGRLDGSSYPVAKDTGNEQASRNNGTGTFSHEPGGGPSSSAPRPGEPNATGTANAAAAEAGEDATKDGTPKKPSALSETDKAMLAGMLKELQGDLSKDKEPKDLKGLSSGGSGSGVVELAKEEASGPSLLGGTILQMTQESAIGLRTPASQAKARRQLSQPDMDFLGIDKSLFTRVHEYFRNKALGRGGTL